MEKLDFWKEFNRDLSAVCRGDRIDTNFLKQVLIISTPRLIEQLFLYKHTQPGTKLYRLMIDDEIITIARNKKSDQKFLLPGIVSLEELLVDPKEYLGKGQAITLRVASYSFFDRFLTKECIEQPSRS